MNSCCVALRFRDQGKIDQWSDFEKYVWIYMLLCTLMAILIGLEMSYIFVLIVLIPIGVLFYMIVKKEEIGRPDESY